MGSDEQGQGSCEKQQYVGFRLCVFVYTAYWAEDTGKPYPGLVTFLIFTMCINLDFEMCF